MDPSETRNEEKTEELKLYSAADIRGAAGRIGGNALKSIERIDLLLQGRICHSPHTHFLFVLANLISLRDQGLAYLEVGTLHGGSMCLVMAGAECKRAHHRYAGVDRFDYYGEKTDPSGYPVSIEIADRNIRYFGNGKRFALFEGQSNSPELIKRVSEYMGPVNMLFLDGAHTNEGIRQDFENYAPMVYPAGLLIFDNYGGEWEDVKPTVDALDVEDEWHVIGPLTKPQTFFVLQRRFEGEERM